MKKILFAVSVAALVFIASCSSDKNYTCPCNGQYGTSFTGLNTDSLCSAWKSTNCPKSWTCTCTMNAPGAILEDQDSLQALGNCALIQQKMQHSYPGSVCNL